MLVSALIVTIYVLSLKQGHSTGLLVVHLWLDGLSRRLCVDCTHCDKRDENEIHLINSPATRYISKAANGDTEDSDLSTNWVESKTTNELREDQLNDLGPFSIKYTFHNYKSVPLAPVSFMHFT
jgi:hypothetical protein